MANNYILTYTGIPFYPTEPRIDDIRITDIAHALSLMCRFNGHVNHLYTVGQHSVNGTKELKALGFDARTQLGFLFHDGSEAYLADLTRPFKQFLPDYQRYEANVQELIYEAIGLGTIAESEWTIIKAIDDEILCHEGKKLKKVWNQEPNLLLPNSVFEYQNPADVEAEFITLADSLLNEIK